MGYMSLYRKYRPDTFESIVGQENITNILKNQVISKKISHAYIFSGSRGTGKTSAAKVFARAINCLNSKEGEPCNECSVCKDILDGNTPDVIEMDAASNNSVENIRQIRQEVVYATVDVKYRVYIIDEAHMLTNSAFNALLKTLEEPPENVVFILATTEQHKIPVTILSRCLRFEFNRLSEETIYKRVEYVLKQENIDYDEDAVEYIAKLGDGALRDALSILERCLSENIQKLTLDKIENIVGTIDIKLVEEISKNIINSDSISAIKNLDLVINKGKDLRDLVYRLIEVFLKLLMENNFDNNANISVSKEKLIFLIDNLSKLDNILRATSRPGIVLKANLISLCKNNDSHLSVQSVDKVDNTSTKSDTNGNNRDIELKISDLYRLIDELKLKVSSGNLNTSSNSDSFDNFKVKEKSDKKDRIDKTKLNSINDKDVEKIKEVLVKKGKIKIYSALAGTSMYKSDDNVYILTSNAFAYNILRDENNTLDIATVLKEDFGIDKELRIELNENKVDNTNKLEKHFKENNIEYTKID
ncbi:MAG: DNA polymerase III subunit gamma/tau [Clostridia bacterium]|nr:DNA polymerase III subunit gamma/tau [Clostridia bacterium]